MNLVWTIAEQALRHHLGGAVSPVMAMGGTALALYALIGFLAAGGLIFFMIGLFLWLGSLYGLQAAAFWTGAAIFAMALAVLGGVMAVTAMRRRRAYRAQAAQMAALQDTLEVLATELEIPVREHPKTAMALATAAGLVMGSRIH